MAAERDAQTTRWWWVRHAPVTVNNGCIYGQTDPICDCDDSASFHGLAGLLPRDAVWVTSNLTRTHMTAAAIVAADLLGPFQAVQAVLPMMRAQKNGLVIHVASWAGRHVSRLTRPIRRRSTGSSR